MSMWHGSILGRNQLYSILLASESTITEIKSKLLIIEMNSSNRALQGLGVRLILLASSHFICLFFYKRSCHFDNQNISI